MSNLSTEPTETKLFQGSVRTGKTCLVPDAVFEYLKRQNKTSNLQIQTIKKGLTYGGRFTRTQAIQIAQRLTYLKTLKTFFAYLYYNMQIKPMDRTVVYVCQALKRYKSLKELDLECMGHHCFTPEGKFYLATALARLKDLESLKLIISNPVSVGDRQIREISQALKKLKNVKKLYIGFSYFQRVHKAGLDKICLALLSLRKLED